MKDFIIYLVAIVAITLISCEGPQGPVGLTGPQGPVGPTGPQGTGSKFTYLGGTIGATDYRLNSEWYIRLEHDSINPDKIITLSICPDPDQYAWLNISEFQVTHGAMYINDADRAYLGWAIWVIIVEED